MRLWTLHPKYLDPRGLVALWREALLAQAVLGGRTTGYTRHPQLIRFRGAPSPADAISFYLHAVQAEAARRGYRFDAAKIASFGRPDPIAVGSGQLDYEWAHLKAKLSVRAPAWLAGFESRAHFRPATHPLFRMVPGPVAEWEVEHPPK
jgi:Pyrimidine dimer DNA glycosylase